MSSEPNSDAVDILSELENDNQDITDITNEQVVTESEKAETSSSDLINENQVKTKSNEKVRNIIFVGNKTIMTYVNSTLTQLSATPVVTIKARGKRITQAVDISQFWQLAISGAIILIAIIINTKTEQRKDKTIMVE